MKWLRFKVRFIEVVRLVESGGIKTWMEGSERLVLRFKVRFGGAVPFE